MVCKQCGLETNVDGAVFCNACGARLDGKKPCAYCAGLNDPSSAFCAFCGKRIDGKTVCSSCGAAFKGAFCSQCGAPANGRAVKVKAVKEKKEKGWWNPLFKWLTAGSMMAAAIFAFIFMFCIGTETEGVSSLSEMVGARVNASSGTSIFDYFGDIYTEIENTAPSMDKMYYGDELVILMYVCAGLGTLVSVSTIVCVTAFIIPATIKFVRFARGKSEDSGAKLALKAVLSYLGGVAAISTISTLIVGYNYDYMSLNIGEMMNGGTIAGITLCLLFLLLSVVSHLVSRGGEWRKPAFIRKKIFAIIGLAFSLALFFVWEGVGISMDIAIQRRYESANFEIFSSPIINVSTFLSIIDSTSLSLGNYDVETATVYIAGLFSQLLMFGGIFCAIGLIVSRIKSVHDEEKTGMGWIIATIILSTLLLATMVVQKLNIEYVFEDSIFKKLAYYTSVGIGSGVALFVLSLLSLAISIVQKILCKQAKEEPAALPVEEIA